MMAGISGGRCTSWTGRVLRRSGQTARIGLPRILRGTGLAVALLGLCACTSLRYTAHVARGHFALLAQRQSVAQVLADPRVDPSLRARLRQTQEARAFASDHLGLPRNRSYTSYVHLHRPYVTWNVFATPEFSVDPVTHCFPFSGCVAYLGFFDRTLAQDEAKRLAANGDDTQVEGAAAYSTLGWFSDPIVSSMLRWDDDELDGVIFHELAHQRIYVKDDSAFNESFASFVQEQGLREWRAARGLAAVDTQTSERDAGFTRLVLELRERLRALYAKPLGPDAMRAAKQVEMATLRMNYEKRRDTDWNGDRRYDHWFDAPINNAKLLPFGLYDRWTPAFARLFAQVQREWPAFYTQVEHLARMPQPQRECRLIALTGDDLRQGDRRPECPS